MSDERTKRPYRKPTLERVQLVGKELAATPNCKRSYPPGGGGKNRTAPFPCGTFGMTRCRDSRGS